MTYRDLVLADNPSIFIEDWPTVEGSGRYTLTPTKVTYVDGVEGNAIALDGTSASYARVNTSFNNTGSIEVWYKPTARPTHYNTSIISGGSGSGLFKIIHTKNGYAEFTTGTSGSATNTHTSDFQFTLDQWHHIAVTRKSYGTAYFYVNGVQVGSQSTGAASVTAQPLTIGFGNPGVVDRLAVYSGTVLPESTILARYDHYVSNIPEVVSLDVEAAQSTFIGIEPTLDISRAYSNVDAPVVGTASFSGLMATTTIDVKGALAKSTWRGLEADFKLAHSSKAPKSHWTGIEPQFIIQDDPYWNLIRGKDPLHFWNNWPVDVGSRNDKSSYDPGIYWTNGPGINANGLVATQNRGWFTVSGNVYNPVGDYDEIHNYTVEAWVKVDYDFSFGIGGSVSPPYSKGTVLSIIRPDDVAGVDYHYQLASGHANSVQLFQRKFVRSTGAVTSTTDNLEARFRHREWNHIAVTDDGKTYINGELAHSTAYSFTKYGTEHTEETATIKLRFANSTSHIDNVAIYPTRLSQSILKEHFDFFNGHTAGDAAKSVFRGLDASRMVGKQPAYIVESGVAGKLSTRGLDARRGLPPLVLRAAPVRTAVRGLAAKASVGVVLRAVSGKSFFNFVAFELATKTKASANSPDTGSIQFKCIEPTLAPSPPPPLEQLLADYPMFYNAADPTLNKKLNNFGLAYMPKSNCGDPDYSIHGIIGTSINSATKYFFEQDALERATGWFSSADIGYSPEFGKSFKFDSVDDVVLVAPTGATHPIAPRSDMNGRQTRGTPRYEGFVTEFWFKSRGPQDHIQMLAGYFYAASHSYTESSYKQADDGGLYLDLETKYVHEPNYRGPDYSTAVPTRYIHPYVLAIDTDGSLLFNGNTFYRPAPAIGYAMVNTPSGPLMQEMEYMSREKVFVADNQWHHIAVTAFGTKGRHRETLVWNDYRAADAMYIVMDGQVLPFAIFDSQVGYYNRNGNWVMTGVGYKQQPDGRTNLRLAKPYETMAPFDTEYPEWKWEALAYNPCSFGNLIGRRTPGVGKDNPAYKVGTSTQHESGLPIISEKVGFVRDTSTGVVRDFIGEKWDPENAPIHIARKGEVPNGEFVKAPKFNMWYQSTSQQFNLVGEMNNILVDAIYGSPIEEIQARYKHGPEIKAVSPVSGAPAALRLRGLSASLEFGPAGPMSVLAGELGKALTGGYDPTMLIRDPMGPPIWLESDAGRAETLSLEPMLELKLAREVIHNLAPGLWNFYGLPTQTELSLLTDANASWTTRMKMPNKTLQPTLGGR